MTPNSSAGPPFSLNVPRCILPLPAILEMLELIRLISLLVLELPLPFFAPEALTPPSLLLLPSPPAYADSPDTVVSKLVLLILRGKNPGNPLPDPLPPWLLLTRGEVGERLSLLRRVLKVRHMLPVRPSGVPIIPVLVDDTSIERRGIPGELSGTAGEIGEAGVLRSEEIDAERRPCRREDERKENVLEE